MIYLDNGATSFPKPRGMVRAMENCMLRYCGNPGRSGHEMSMKTGEEVYKARRKIAEAFGIDNPERLVFTKNTTEALNMGLLGTLQGGDHVITTSMEHNSVLRPLKSLEKKGITHSIVRGDREGTISPYDIEKSIRPNTKMLVITAASNVTGTKMPLAELGSLAKRKGLLFMVDGAQGAGHMDLDVNKLKVDMLACPGHKGLLGPLGSGFLYVAPGVSISPVMTGGTGTQSKSRLQPTDFPDGFESGTINAPAIIGLGHAVDFVEKIGIDVIGQYEEELIRCLDEELLNMRGICVYGPEASKKTGITLINVDGMNGEEVTSLLSRDYNIAVRGGYHCAGLAHKTIGTWNQGAVRISVGPFNTKKDIKCLIDALREISLYGQKI